MNWNFNDKRQTPPSGPSRFEELFQKLLNDPSAMFKALIVLLILAGVYTSIYTVKPQEQAVITRFGRYQSTQLPGLHFKLPFGIERAQKVQTQELRQEAFGYYLEENSRQTASDPFRSLSQRVSSYSSQRRNLEEESLMLTGDLNVANVEWVVQYRVADPKKFLFSLVDPVKTVRDIGLAASRQVIGDKLINDVLTTGRNLIEGEVRELIQQILDSYDSGLLIEAVQLQGVTPPEPVAPSFNEVNAALQEQKQAINRAEAQRNKVIPEAKGVAEERESKAEGYAASVLNTAKGDAERFRRVYAEYKKSPEVTARRLYLELTEEVLSRMDNLTLIDKDVHGVLPILGQTGALKTLEQSSGGRAQLSSQPRSSTSPSNTAKD